MNIETSVVPPYAVPDRNVYGDNLGNRAGVGHGVDIGSQRMDDLDFLAVECLAGLPLGSRIACDLGCGKGGLLSHMRGVGAIVIGVDNTPIPDAPVFGQGRAEYIQADLRDTDFNFLNGVSVVTCQRTIHYFPAAQAVYLLSEVRRNMRSAGDLFISASGLNSELGEGYPHAGYPLFSRFAKLSPVMQEKHGILAPVCLYDKEGLAEVLTAAGFIVEIGFVSTFGNIKMVARGK